MLHTSWCGRKSDILLLDVQFLVEEFVVEQLVVPKIIIFCKHHVQIRHCLSMFLLHVQICHVVSLIVLDVQEKVTVVVLGVIGWLVVAVHLNVSTQTH